MTKQNTVVIDVVDPVAGDLRETVLTQQPNEVPFPIFEVNNGRQQKKMRLEEAASLPNFPNVLRTGLRPILLSEYAGYPSTYRLWMDSEPSDSEYEYGLEFRQFGELPYVEEDEPFPELKAKEDRSVYIQNRKRGARFNVTWEMLKFEKTGHIREQTQFLGRAMAQTVEKQAYDLITDTSNYTRTTSDNAVGNNYGTVTFSATGLLTGYDTLRTMFDRGSGMPLNVMPNTLICGIGLDLAARQLLTSANVGGMGDTDAVLTYGTGTSNPFRGWINQIIVTPFLGRYEWVLMEAGRAAKEFVTFETELLTQGAEGYDYFQKMTFGYRVARGFGMGMWNDRFAYFSNSTTAPTVT